MAFQSTMSVLITMNEIIVLHESHVDKHDEYMQRIGMDVLYLSATPTPDPRRAHPRRPNVAVKAMESVEACLTPLMRTHYQSSAV